MSVLNRIDSSADIKALSEEELKTLADEMRVFLVESVSKTGGHLASNLGAVELTLALHRVYDTAVDRIVFDVGHQSYVHKIITGRRDRFGTLRDTMAAIGVTGMTVTNVMGCGTQKGKSGQYRGIEMSMHLIPKLQIDIVVSKVDPELVVAAANAALHTGEIGDGKIFVYDVEDVVRIRTGESGYDALQISGE